MALSQFFVLSPRGDTIILKDFRGDCDPMSHEVFFRKVGRNSAVYPPPFLLTHSLTHSLSGLR